MWSDDALRGSRRAFSASLDTIMLQLRNHASIGRTVVKYFVPSDIPVAMVA